MLDKIFFNSHDFHVFYLQHVFLTYVSAGVWKIDFSINPWVVYTVYNSLLRLFLRQMNVEGMVKSWAELEQA